MNKLLVGSAAVVALVLAGPALAADLPVKAPVYKAPVMAPAVYDWTGFYVGGNIGYSWADWDSTTVGGNFTFPGSPTAFSNTASPNVNGPFAGGQAGYNWQFNPHWLVGIEGDFEWSGEKASDPGNASVSIPSGIGVGICDAHPPCTATVTAATTNDWKLPWFATLRGRFGYVADQTWLIYGTGGVAFGEMEFATSTTATGTITNAIGQTFPGFPVTVSTGASQNVTRVGWVIGGGIEKMLSQNWTAKIEYQYLDWGSYTFLAGTGFDTNVRLRDNTIRVGLNYKFGGPVVAKY
ncbi:MAG: porin family protein [Hyphomicrobiales bacterium]|nr:porin family protein [Hyphomicrobiales bacterium]MBV8825119.1 porin family protein [Hyphomicrobiales bacterium]MBV9427010.1 porin family protein [Bradyrhizobiaceae bacterium]